MDNFLSKANLDPKISQSMEDNDVSQKVMSGLYGRGTYSIREVDYVLLTRNCCTGQYHAARLLRMEELEAAAMIDKKAGHDHGVYETLTLGPLTSTEDFVADDAKYIYCLLYTSPSPRDRQKSRMPSSA